jgi:hypothetical protein
VSKQVNLFTILTTAECPKTSSIYSVSLFIQWETLWALHQVKKSRGSSHETRPTHKAQVFGTTAASWRVTIHHNVTKSLRINWPHPLFMIMYKYLERNFFMAAACLRTSTCLGNEGTVVRMCVAYPKLSSRAVFLYFKLLSQKIVITFLKIKFSEWRWRVQSEVWTPIVKYLLQQIHTSIFPPKSDFHHNTALTL